MLANLFVPFCTDADLLCCYALSLLSPAYSPQLWLLPDFEVFDFCNTCAGHFLRPIMWALRERHPVTTLLTKYYHFLLTACMHARMWLTDILAHGHF